MFTFFYDSLDTLKKVKKPTGKEIVQVTISIFIAVIVSAVIFAVLDGFFGALYREFYTMMQ